MSDERGIEELAAEILRQETAIAEGRAVAFGGYLLPTGMSTPIPNDDPRCHCTADTALERVDDETVRLTGGEPGSMATVSIRADCPLHGAAIGSIARSTLGAVSIGRKPVPRRADHPGAVP
jgi:hypothetical protein